MAALRQSFSWWCFVNRGLAPEELLRAAARIGYAGVELIDEALWPLARRHGLGIVSANGHQSIENGLNRREHATRIEAELRANIQQAARWNIPVLICFSGNRAGLADGDGMERCAETLARVAPAAADAGVTLAVELLNSKVDHRDYQADRTAWGVALCEQVNSPAVKLLYDIYHMQVMEGDVIRTIQTRHRHFAHYHTAGNPGRGQPDENQELNYPAIYRAIAATGYTGYLGHEFIPRLDAGTALARAFADCAGA
ncbi:MAG: TIM barrel protein [Verrucomicrobiales bacterium]|jgi:hydroxypyruvate isomerase|nr:TIM barrel protein [Verrucomicrobiales bacterium]